MDFPVDLKAEIEQDSQDEFGNPTTDFGTRMFTKIYLHTGQELPTEIVNEFNDWSDLFVGEFITWREFVLWVWNKIVEWWLSLWE